MSIILNGTSGITNDSGYTGDGVAFADATPANTLVTTVGGNVGIGTSSPSSKLTVSDGTVRIDTSPFSGTGFQGTQSNHPFAFITNNTERARIDSSGNFLVGATSVLYGGCKLNVSCGPEGIATKTSLSTYSPAVFLNSSGTIVGYIYYNGTSTSYNTSSDYRLKDTIAPMTGTLARVAALRPCTYKWKVDGSDGQGFIAHELDEVVPGCVTGEKDAVDAEGKPQYQGIDTSFLVATLAAAIQEQQAMLVSLKAIIDTQATRITALEAK